MAPDAARPAVPVTPAAAPVSQPAPVTVTPPTSTAPAYSLPMAVVGPVDVGRLSRELEGLDNVLRQLSLRTGGSEVKMPKTSALMDQCLQQNKLNLLQVEHRQALAQYLEHVRKQAPLLHMSFSADPSPDFIEKLMAWLRHNIHPQVLLTVGLQPNIGAGCIIRSTNKYFDCSLRQNFVKQREALAGKLFPPVTVATSTAQPTPATPVSTPAGVTS